ncbi:MAG: hypothetical protein J5I81_13335 [Nitrococcus mobilis]|nr:hypothetical protein [Nitrococcus mobilis]
MDRQSVRCQGKERDRYGRMVAVCYHKGQNLNGAYQRSCRIRLGGF